MLFIKYKRGWWGRHFEASEQIAVNMEETGEMAGGRRGGVRWGGSQKSSQL